VCAAIEWLTLLFRPFDAVPVHDRTAAAHTVSSDDAQRRTCEPVERHLAGSEAERRVTEAGGRPTRGSNGACDRSTCLRAAQRREDEPGSASRAIPSSTSQAVVTSAMV
jgi:hypothetical protein